MSGSPLRIRVADIDAKSIESPEDLQGLLRLVVEQVVMHAASDGPREQVNTPHEVIVDFQLGRARYALVCYVPMDPPLHFTLSPREREIVRLVAKGYANKTIAGVLDISLWTVATHLRRVFAKLGVSSRAEMVARVLADDSTVPRDGQPVPPSQPFS